MVRILHAGLVAAVRVFFLRRLKAEKEDPHPTRSREDGRGLRDHFAPGLQSPTRLLDKLTFIFMKPPMSIFAVPVIESAV